jgi:hypothetical protein
VCVTRVVHRRAVEAVSFKIYVVHHMDPPRD